MSRCLVTGAAGFIGSHLCEALLEKGHDVVGLDAFIPYYPRSVKERNLEHLLRRGRFQFIEADLRKDELSEAVSDCEVIFHLAAMAGLQKSWSDLALYSSCNILGTQQLLEAARYEGTPHFIQVSTSSAYGREATGPETSSTAPCSPYGITKLAAEQLCFAYQDNFGLPVTILRYFSVYGPRQRPDMGYNILIRCLMQNKPFMKFGDGEQTRSNTYVADCVNATLLAFENRDAALGEVFNVGGGEIVSLNSVINILEEITGKEAMIELRDPRPGDQQHTAANIEKIKTYLGYAPMTPVREGLQAQIDWQKELINLHPKN